MQHPNDTGPKTALVSGAAGGMGRATVSALLAAGWCVAACDHDDGQLAALSSFGYGADRLTGVAADIADPAACASAVRDAAERFGRLDAVVNMAAIVGTEGELDTLTPEDWRAVLATNLMGTVWLTTAAIPHLKATRGVVVNIASTSAYQAEVGEAPYAVSKAAVIGFTNNAAAELGPHGIRVVAIAPGWVETPMTRAFMEERGVLGKPIPMTMLRRIGRPEEIAATVMFLLSDGAANITGTTITVDGGQTNHSWPLRPGE